MINMVFIADNWLLHVTNFVRFCIFISTWAGIVISASEQSQNTILLASTQAVYKAPHSTVGGHICQSVLDQRASASRKS